jgi:hypothetical protein
MGVPIATGDSIAYFRTKLGADRFPEKPDTPAEPAPPKPETPEAKANRLRVERGLRGK